MRTLWMRLKAFVRKHSLERELDAELQFHLEMQIEENLGKGMSPDEARAQARRSFGGVEQIKETYRDQRGFRALDTMIQAATSKKTCSWQIEGMEDTGDGDLGGGDITLRRV